MARGVNKVILIDLYLSGRSIPQVSDASGISRSTVRYHLLNAGVLRTRKDGVRIAGEEGRLGSGTRGKRRVFSEKWKRNISKARRKHSDFYAAGVSLKPNGYVEVTKGDHKGRGLHRVIVEEKLGRPLNYNEVVHHIDGNRSNNDSDNLMVMTASEHCRHHAIENSDRRLRDKRGRFI